MGFVANFIRFPAVQNFDNRLRFDNVTESLKVGTFFETQRRLMPLFRILIVSAVKICKQSANCCSFRPQTPLLGLCPWTPMEASVSQTSALQTPYMKISGAVRKLDMSAVESSCTGVFGGLLRFSE